MKKGILLILISTLSVIGCGSKPKEDDPTFKPILRFLLTSDIHLQNSIGANDTRLKKAFDYTYQYCESQDYKTLDAALFGGDIANTGSKVQFKRFFDTVNEKKKEETAIITTLGNHELDFCEEEGDPVEIYKQYSKTDEDTHTIIKGFHFISLCPTSGLGFDQDKVTWLDAELAKANSDTPNKPIFVLEHHPAMNTVYGSFGDPSGVDDLLPALTKYPNVVNMTGHSHFSIMDPRSLYQGDFTAINCGSPFYPDFAINELRHYGIKPVDQYGRYTLSGSSSYSSGSEFQIVEVSEKGSLKIIGVDLQNERQLFERFVESTTDKTKFITNDMKKSKYKVFEWEETDEAMPILCTDEVVEITFPQIETKLDEIIESYRVYVTDSQGKEVFKSFALSNYNRVDRPEVIIASASELELQSGQELFAKVYAVNPYNVLSTKPLENSFIIE